jgi:hypothetical protein
MRRSGSILAASHVSTEDIMPPLRSDLGRPIDLPNLMKVALRDFVGIWVYAETSFGGLLSTERILDDGRRIYYQCQGRQETGARCSSLRGKPGDSGVAIGTMPL